ncbi:MAG: tetratricopeptide repeat protein [Acidobacteriaceae bacterium]|jgi:tetratricopeptide (TPR) repeat protein
MTSSRQLSRCIILCLPAIVSSFACYANGQSKEQTDPGRTALQHGDYLSAEMLYRQALRQNPDSPELLSDLGIALQLQGRSTDAIHAFEQALKLKRLPRTYALLAEEKCKIRDLDGARPMLNRIIRDYAGDAGIIAVVAPCYLDLNESVDSVKAYTVLLRDKSYPHDLSFIQLSKSYLAASQYFVTRLRERSDGKAYITALGQASTSGDPRSAFPMAQRASPNFHPDLGFDAVLTIWHQHEDDPALLYQLAVLSGEQSMQQIELCSQQYPDSPYLAQLRLQMLVERGREDEAVSGFEELLHSHPELPDLRYDLGMLYRKQRQWEKALAVFYQELDANPQEERAAARVSEALEQMTRWQELRDFLAPRMQKKSPALWASLDFARALEHLGENREAMHVLATALASYPSSKEVHWRLLHLYRVSGDMQKASAEVNWFKTRPE